LKPAFKKYVIEEGEGIVFDQERETDMVVHDALTLLDDILFKCRLQLESKVSPVKQAI
jgi:hypothetical protein